MIHYLSEVLGRHLREDSIEVALVLFVDESVVKHTLSLMAVQPEDLIVFANHSRICLQYTCNNPHT